MINDIKKVNPICPHFVGTVNPEEAKADKPVDCKCGEDIVAINPTYCASSHYTNCPWFKKKQQVHTAVDVSSSEQVAMSEHERALELHAEIMMHKENAANALYAMCFALKKMRDTKWYIELGFEDWGEYCEKKAGIKQRWAYSYVATLEKLGKDVLQSNAKIGITKLELLTHVPELDRKDFVEQTNLEDISVAELKKKIADLEKEQGLKAAQLSMFEEKVEKLEADAADASKMEAEIDKLRKALDRSDKEKSELTKTIKELESKPVDVAVQGISADDKKAIETAAIEKALAEVKKQEAENVKAAVEKEKKESDKAVKKVAEQAKKAEEKHNAEISVKNDEIAKLKKQLEEANAIIDAPKPSAIAEGDAITKCKVYFENMQEQVELMLTAFEDIVDADTKKRYAEVLRDTAKDIIEAVAEYVMEE